MLTLSLLFISSLVLPVGFAALILSWKELRQERRAEKLQKISRGYAEEKVKERKRLEKDISALDKLLKQKSIDPQTHERYMRLLQMGHEKKQQQSKARFSLAKKTATAK